MIPKFRAWYKLTKTMQDVLTIDFLNKTVEITQTGIVWFEADKVRSLEDVVLMQSTGLHDSTKFEELSEEEQLEWLESGNTEEDWKGREIFQGDVVNPDRAKQFAVKHFIFGQGVFKNALITNGGHGFDGIYHGSSVEITGNIYENPELLDVVE